MRYQGIGFQGEERVMFKLVHRSTKAREEAPLS
jgi:hypothetical protein